VRPEDLEGYKKRRRASKEERLMKIVSGKNTFEHAGHAGGLTNAEKKRKKNYMMVRKGKRDVFSKLRDTQQEQKARKVKGKKSEFAREARKRRRC
jgi:protein SDA1